MRGNSASSLTASSTAAIAASAGVGPGPPDDLGADRQPHAQRIDAVSEPAEQPARLIAAGKSQSERAGTTAASARGAQSEAIRRRRNR